MDDMLWSGKAAIAIARGMQECKSQKIAKLLRRHAKCPCASHARRVPRWATGVGDAEA